MLISGLMAVRTRSRILSIHSKSGTRALGMLAQHLTSCIALTAPWSGAGFRGSVTLCVCERASERAGRE